MSLENPEPPYNPGLILKDNFVDEAYLCKLEHIVNQGIPQPYDSTKNHVVRCEYYAWNVIPCELQRSPLRYRLLSELSKVFRQDVPTENLNPIQLFAKEADKNSICSPHVEDPNIYGPWVFMLYLSNEEDGALHLNGVKILPRRNRLVAMQTGVEHWVERCSGRRLNITGWSYAPSWHRRSPVRET